MSASVSVPATADVYQPLTRAAPEQTSDSAAKNDSRHKHLAGTIADSTFKTWLTDPSVFVLR